MKPLTGKHETLLKRENMKPEQVNSEFAPPPSLTTPGKLKASSLDKFENQGETKKVCRGSSLFSKFV